MLRIAADHPAFAGHFPGQPLLPGVVLIAEVLESMLARPEWAALIGAGTATLNQTKFLAPVRPGDELALQLTATTGGRVSFEIRCGARVAASGQLQAGGASDAS